MSFSKSIRNEKSVCKVRSVYGTKVTASSAHYKIPSHLVQINWPRYCYCLWCLLSDAQDKNIQIP